LRSPTLPPATHTNCFVVGADDVIVVDPGSPYPEEQAALDAALAGRRVREIWATHHHFDHVGGAPHPRAPTRPRPGPRPPPTPPPPGSPPPAAPASTARSPTETSRPPAPAACAPCSPRGIPPGTTASSTRRPGSSWPGTWSPAWARSSSIPTRA